MFESLLSILLAIYPGVELLGHVVILSDFLRTTILYSVAAIPFYIPTSNVQGFQSFHILINTCFLVFDFRELCEKASVTGSK